MKVPFHLHHKMHQPKTIVKKQQRDHHHWYREETQERKVRCNKAAWLAGSWK